MKLNNASRIEGKFKLQVRNAETGEVKNVGWQDNVVLNQLLSTSVNKSSSLFYCLFGTGNTVPDKTQTSLANPLVTKHYIQSNQYGNGSKVNKTRVGDIHRKEITVKLSGAQGQVQGNVSELGLASSSIQSSLFTRALIKDELGNPTTLSLGPNDILTVWYTVTLITDCSVSELASKQFTFDGQQVTATLKLINQDIALTTNAEAELLSYNILSIGSYEPVSVRMTDLFYKVQPNMSIAGGSITDSRAVQYNEVTLTSSGTSLTSLGLQSSNEGGVGIKYYITSAKEFLAGSYTGEWRYLFFSSYPGSPLSTQDIMARCNLMIEFNPPLTKTAADKFTFDTLDFLHGVVPV